VVENGTGPEALARLNEALSSDQIISTPVNLGYAGGMNLGIRKALEEGADYLWLLTKDLTVEDNCLEILCSLWPRLQNPGFLGSLTDLNGTDAVYFFRSVISPKGQTAHGNRGRTIEEIPELIQEYGVTDYVNGACVFTHRRVIEEIGLIPEDYFLYFEDCEWGLRAKRAGFANYVSYRSRVHHHREVGAFSATAEYYCRRNSFLFKKRNGFIGPLTKTLELLKLRKAALKSFFRRDWRMLQVLNAVSTDVKNEKSGLGPWR
jgi:GT2 family glycosyltransferase